MINTAILGCGTIGSGVYETVVRNQEILVKELGDHIRVKKILDLRTFPGEPFADLVTADFSEIENDLLWFREGLPLKGKARRHEQQGARRGARHGAP